MVTRQLTHAITAAALAIALSLAALELVVRVMMPRVPFTEPAHDVLFLAPDRVVGWKHVERFAFPWNGRNPYCLEFRVDVSTNSVGFRDDEWSLAKPPGV